MFNVFKHVQQSSEPSRVFLTNTLTRKVELFTPLKKSEVTMYSCGPTVYGKQHVGNMVSALFSDTVYRTLTIAGYSVRKVVNITDVGHMVGDGDQGEDKMAAGAKRDNMTPEEVAHTYATLYFEDLRSLNIDLDTITFTQATKFIDEQIALIETLRKKGYTYMLADGLYFDTSKFPKYGILGDVQKIRLIGGARVKPDAGKRNLHDFALWRKAKPGDLQQWNSPWGRGNPGWHIECSAMIETVLGETIDIHTGGEDHIMVHHNNEIAQSEGAHDKPLAKYFLHNAFLSVNGEKISKSLGNTPYVSDVIDHGNHPLAFRLFALQTHYLKPSTFTFEAVSASNEALHKLWRKALIIKRESKEKSTYSESLITFKALLFDDFGTPQALAHLHKELDSENLRASDKWALLELADKAFGLLLTKPPLVLPITLSELPKEIQDIARRREKARKAKDYATSDLLRDTLLSCGYVVEDGGKETLYTKTK